MRRRYLVYGGVIAALIVVNLARGWLGSAPGGPRSPLLGQAPVAEDFRLRANVPEVAEVKRNLFAPRAALASVELRSRPVQAVVVARPAAAPPPPPPVETPVAATTNLDRLGLLGVVFREGQGQAYLSLNKNSVIAHRGDTVFGHFTVEKVAVDAVELRDLTNNTIRRIPVSGR